MIPLSVETIRGPWVSLGIHIDFQQRYMDLHVLWWIITIGEDYRVRTQEETS